MHIDTDLFILSADWRDERGRLMVRYTGLANQWGPIELEFDNQRPVFFVEREAILPPALSVAERRELPLTNFAGRHVDALYFSTYRDLRAADRSLREAGISSFEADVRPTRRFLMERFICAQARVSGAALRQGRQLMMRNPRISIGEATPTLVAASLDIETGVASGRLYSIALHLTDAGPARHRVFMLADERAELPANLSLYPSEAELLTAFFDWFADADPDVIIGWNIVGFDLDFLERKCRELGMTLRLGRGGRAARLREQARGGPVAEVPGRIVIDGPMALRTAFYSFPDYRLETVARVLLGKGKIISPDQDKIAEIERLFQEDKAALARYNLEDCILVSRIFERTGLLEMYVKRSQIAGLLLDYVGRSVAAFDHYYLPRLHRKGFVAPNVRDVHLSEHAAGGYVLSPRPGIYDHVIVLDFKSLYPTIIQSFKIEPLALLRRDVDTLATPDGHHFSASENLLPEFIDRLMQQRNEARRAGDTHLSQAIKILMNSFYGVMGTPGCRFYHPALPSAITGTGQWLLQHCKARLEEMGYTVHYGDTDSLFVGLQAGEESDPETAGRDLLQKLNSHLREELARRGVESYLEMEYEKYYRKFVVPMARATSGGAKKRYVGLRIDRGDPYPEFIGMEYVRSDWSPLAKEFQYELYLRLLTGREYKSWLREFVKSLLTGQFDDKLVYHKRLRKDPHDYSKNVSPQVRAARMLARPGRDVRYIMTMHGPVPLERNPRDVDYRHYIERQLLPIADSLLNLTGTSFAAEMNLAQGTLFDESAISGEDSAQH